MHDATGRTAQATIIATTPIAEGWVEYELEVPADVDTTSLEFSDERPEADIDVDESSEELCDATAFVGSKVRRCILPRGHAGVHQYQL